MIGVEQWRASIGLYHPHSHQQLARVSHGERQPPIYHLVGIPMSELIPAELLVCGTLFIIWILVNGYSLLKGELTCIMASKKRTSGTRLLVTMWSIRQAVTEAISGCLERSVRARAILLIMAGDVEQNPGPLPPASASPESKALRHHFASLVTAIADPLRFSLTLYSARMIERTTKDKANLPTMTIDEKNDILLSAVMSRVDSDPSIFHQLVDYLKKNGDETLKSWGGKLEDTCSESVNVEEGFSGCRNKFAKEDAERCTLLAKQPELSPSHFGTQPSQHHLQPSQPHPQLSYHPSQHHTQPSQPHPYPNLDPYNFEQLQMYLPHSQPHLQPSQPLPHPSQSLPHPSQPPPHPSQLHGYYSYHLMYPHPSPMHPHIPHPSTTHPPPPPPTKQTPPPPPTQQIEHSPPPPPPPPPPFQFFVSFLRNYYNSEIPLSYCKWPPVPKKKYINLAAISREEVSSAELKQFQLATVHGDVDQILGIKAPIQLQDILETKKEETLHHVLVEGAPEAILKKKEEPLHRVLVEGAPGVGKTTLSWEICKRWGRGELFQQYIAIMLLRLRDRTVQNAKTIMDLVCYMYDDEDEGFGREISKHLKETQGKDILIILEGLDELPKHLLNTRQSFLFTHLLSRKVLPNATILVTSRPSATVQLRTGWEISRHIEVLGFTEKDITDYIQSALSPQKFSAFDSYLSTHPNIRLLMYIPLNCAIVVEVYRSCQQSGCSPPTTATELYTRLVQTILTRYLDSHPDYKLKNDKPDIEQFTDLLPPVSQHFHKLTEMAYHGVLNHQLIFEDQHIEHLGFMDSITELFSIKREVTYSYNFLHLSLQEYLAAYYVSLKSMYEQQQLLQSMRSETHLMNMGRFLAGITKYQGMDRAAIKAVIEQQCRKGIGGRLELSSHALQLLHEIGDYRIIDGHPSYSCSLSDYSPLLDFAVLGYCIANTSYKWTLQLGGHGEFIQSTDRIAMFIQTLKSHSNPSYSIEKIKCCYDAPECVQCLLLELPQNALQYIQTLVLESKRHNPHPLPLPVLELILSKMSRLHTLGLNDGAVSTTDAVAFAELIKNNNTLRLVGLVGNHINVEGVEALVKITRIKKDLGLIM